MDIEQLRMVLEALSTTSGDAKEVLIWWLVSESVVPLVNGLLLTAFGVAVLVAAKRLITSAMHANQVAYRMAEKLGRPVEICWISSDVKAVLERLDEVLSRANRK